MQRFQISNKKNDTDSAELQPKQQFEQLLHYLRNCQLPLEIRFKHPGAYLPNTIDPEQPGLFMFFCVCCEFA